MAINKEINTQILVTIPRTVKVGLEDLAVELSEQEESKITVSDLMREGAKIILKEHGKRVD